MSAEPTFDKARLLAKFARYVRLAGSDTAKADLLAIFPELPAFVAKTWLPVSTPVDYVRRLSGLSKVTVAGRFFGWAERLPT